MGKHNSKSETAYSSSMEKNDFSKFPLQDLPDDILVEVFIHVPGRDLAKSCSRVCRRWYCLLKTQKLWKDKCIRRFNFPCDTMAALSGVLHADFKYIYFLNPYNRNLLENPDASEGLKRWTIKEDGGDGFSVEKTPHGCDPVCKFTGPEYEGKTIGCWSTSYRHCYKEQTIDLIREGCSVEVLDHVRPNINVSEWYAARFDCGIKYKLCVELLKKKDDAIPLDVYTFKDNQPAGREWFNVQHTFSKYEPGVRYIRFTHGGKDTQFWAGHYGVKVTLASVKFDLKHTAGPETH